MANLQDFEERLGGEVRQYKTDSGVFALLQQGVIVTIKLSRFRGKLKLTWLDLAEEESADAEKLFSLGMKKLMPSRYLKAADAVESGLRKAVERRTVQVYHGQFLPVTAFADVAETVKEYTERYYGIRDEIVGGYDEWRAEMRQSYLARARELFWARGGKGDEEGFVARYVDGIEGHIPSAQEIYESFAVDVQYTYIPMADEIAAAEAAAAGIRIQVDAAGEKAAADARLHREKVQAEIDITRAKVLAEETVAENRQRALDAMNQAAVESARRTQRELLDNFRSDVALRLRSLVVDALTDMAAKIRAKKFVHGRQIVSIQRLISDLEFLNFVGDPEIISAISDLQAKVLDIPAQNRDFNEVAAAIADLQAEMGRQIDAIEATRGIRGDLLEQPAIETIEAIAPGRGRGTRPPVTPATIEAITPGRGRGTKRFAGATI